MIENDDSWANVKEISDTQLLISLNHVFGKLAKMELFDISKKDKVKKVYSFQEVSGGKLLFFSITCNFILLFCPSLILFD